MGENKKRRTKPGTKPEHRYEAFANFYIANGENATQAAISAGYSPKTAYSLGQRLLKHVEVRAMIESRREELRQKYRLTSDDVIRSIHNELYFDPAKLYDENGDFLAIKDLPENIRLVLSGIEQTSATKGLGEKAMIEYITKLRWPPKFQAREQAMKFLGMFEKDNQQKHIFTEISREKLKLMAEQIESHLHNSELKLIKGGNG